MAPGDKGCPSSPFPTSLRTRLRCSSVPQDVGFRWTALVQFFYPWATLVSQLLGGLSSHPVLLKSPKRPGFSLTTAVREQHLSSTITAAHEPPIFLAELPIAVQEQ
ncbi:hypothetical protein SynA1562_00963 [Synechococcus sp. A15-62]|nr:hypothetical protein SynA1562_00963 [Synechococcus sp. A15-62]